MKKINRTLINIIIYSMFIATIAHIPFFKNFSRVGFDTIYHLNRIEGMAKSILDGNWFPNVYPYKLNGYGYVTPTFYCDFLLIIPALIYNFGIPIFKTYKITILVLSILSGVSIGYTIYNISKNQFATYLGITLYVFSQYRLHNVYVRGALGEIFGYVFLPLVILGAKSILFDNKPKSIYLILAFSGLILSHNISFFMGCILLGIIFIIYSKEFFNTPSKFVHVIKATVITILLTAFYTFPMIEMSKTQNFLVFGQLNLGELLESNSISVISLITDTFIGFDHPYSLRHSLGFSIYLCVFLLLFIKVDNNKLNNFMKTLVFLGLIFILFSTNLIPWKHLGFLSIIQFPTRLMLISTTCLCISIPILFYNSNFYIKNKKTILILSLIIFIQIFYHLFQINKFDTPYLDNSAYTYIIESSPNKPGETNLSKTTQRSINELAGNNYLNVVMLNRTDWSQQITNVANGIISENVIKDGPSTSFFLENTIENESVVFPVIYYKGMMANCIDSKGLIKNLETKLHTDTCLTEVILNNNTFQGKITVWYNGTRLQKYSLILSVVSFIMYIIIYIITRMRRLYEKKI